MNKTRDREELLWPYGRTAALLAIPVIWLLLASALSLARRYAGWPDAESRTLAFSLVAVAGAIPLLLVLLDFASARRAVVDLKGFKIDFSRIDISQPSLRRESFRLPDNVGVPGAIVSDSSPMEIVSTLKEATANEIVRLDLRTGEAWWSTRLLALAAGAVRAGSPAVLVFVGQKEKVEGAFLGWATPADVLASLLGDDDQYREAYDRSRTIAHQLAAFGDPMMRPPALVLAPEVFRYASHPDYAGLGEAAFEQVLMDQLAPMERSPNAPDRLTLARFEALFLPVLYREAVDLEQPNERQVAALLEAQAPYLALTRGKRYEGMLKQETVERLILRELLTQAQQAD